MAGDGGNGKLPNQGVGRIAVNIDNPSGGNKLGFPRILLNRPYSGTTKILKTRPAMISAMIQGMNNKVI
jgi:hypothetical protein